MSRWDRAAEDAAEQEQRQKADARDETMAAEFEAGNFLPGKGLDEPPLRKLRLVPLDGFMEETPESHPFIAYPWLPALLLTLLTGHGGAGKSMLALIFAAHAAAGATWAGYRFDRCRVLYVSLEDSPSLVRYRLRRICETYGLNSHLVEENLIVLDGTGGDASLMIEVNDHGQRSLIATPLLGEIEEVAAGCGFIIIDNASDAYSGNENDRRQVRTFIRRLVDVAAQNNAGVMLLAHIDKQAARLGAAGNSYSGSTAWHNSARSRLALTANDDGTVELIQEKMNLEKRAEPILLAWDDRGVLVPQARPAVGPEAEIEQLRADAEQLLPAIAAAVAAGIRVPTATSGSSTAWSAISHLPEVSSVFRARGGKGRFFAALERLQRDGSIRREDYQDAHRNKRSRWELTHAGELRSFVSPPIPPALTNARGACGVSDENSQLTRTNATDAGQAYLAARDGAA